VAGGRPGEAAEAVRESPLFQLGTEITEFTGERVGEVRAGETETAIEETREVVTSPAFIARGTPCGSCRGVRHPTR
jgi:hypothetical protein